MPRKKLEEKDRCLGVRPSGTRCIHRAVFGVPPKWCSKCDPSPEAVQRRREAGAKRHAPGTPEAVQRDEVRAERAEARVEGTLDDIVRHAVEASKELLKESKAMAGKDSLASARLAQSAAALHRAAISALRARGHVGDIPDPKRQHSPNPLHPDGVPAPATSTDAMAALNQGLDS